MSRPQDSVTVRGRGRVVGTYESMRIQAGVECFDTESVLATAKAREALAVVRSVIESCAPAAGVATEAVRIDLDVRARYGPTQITGFVAHGSCTVEASNIPGGLRLQRALTEVPNVAVSSPAFLMGDASAEEARTAAFAEAYARALREFRAQCAVVGLDPEEFRVVNWSVSTPGGGGGKTLGADDEVTAGQAVVLLDVAFVFRRDPPDDQGA